MSHVSGADGALGGLDFAMSLFSSIMHKVFGGAAVAQRANAPDTDAPAAGPPAADRLAAAAAMPGGTNTGVPPVPVPAASGMGATPVGPPPVPAAMPTAGSAAAVDVEAVLTELATRKGGGGNWKTSIVDLLKMLDLDSSLAARKELAQELGVHAGADGSAEQNTALSRAVWQQLAQNGGHVPESLKA